MSVSVDQSPVLMRVCDWFFPTESIVDERLEWRGRMLLAIHAIGAVVLVWTSTYQIAFGWRPLGLASLGFLPLMCILPIAMKLGAPIRILTSAGVVLFYGLTIGITISTAGQWPGGPLFLILTPAAAVLLVGRRAGLVWSVVTIASLVSIRSFGGPDIDLSPIPLAPSEIEAARFRLYGVVSTVVFAMAYF